MIEATSTAQPMNLERHFIQHPEDVPIEIYVQSDSAQRATAVPAVGARGLRFNTNVYLESGTLIKVSIPVVDPCFEALCWVVWCGKADHGFEVGVSFLENTDAIPIQMVEQICYIKHYKQQVFDREGRVLTTEEAAIEWMRDHADAYPLLQAATYCH